MLTNHLSAVSYVDYDVTAFSRSMSSAANDLTIRFWGARGSIPAPGTSNRRFGGNTPCIVMRQGQEPPLIVDAGTGIRAFGSELEGSTLEANILFSHFHWDHIQGLPFLQPLYYEESRVTMYSTHSAESLERILRGQMEEPYFPIPYSALRAQIAYAQIGNKGMQIGSFHIRPICLNHPGGCSGYRIDSPSGSVVYASDHEHGDESIDSGIAEIADGADILIYDSHFTPAEYKRYQGWGHSTWLEGTKLAKRARAGRLILFHHNPSRSDEQMDMLLAEAKAEFPATQAAEENRLIIMSDT